MKVKLLASIVTTAVLAVSSANAMPPKPAKCPGATALQSVSLQLAERDNDGLWVVGVMSNVYDTKDKWTFVLAKIPAASDKDAKTHAAEAMKTLKFAQGPIPVEQYGVWACAYSNAKNFPGISVTPALGFAPAKKLAV